MDIGLKSFVSEDELANVKRIKQEQWELKRKPDDPIECPEQEFDNRTLFERLKEQKDKKQEEFDESRKLKHCIKLLDNDEIEFLEKVDELKMNEAKNKLAEEKRLVEEFKSHVSNLTNLEQEKKINEFKKSLFSKSNTTTKESTNQLAGTTTRRQAKLLANAVKRKSSSEKDNEDEQSNKKFKSNNTQQSNNGDKDDGDKNNDDKDNKDKEQNDVKIVLVEQKQPTALKVLGVLPGLSSYDSDTSDSENSDSSASETSNFPLHDYLLASRK